MIDLLHSSIPWEETDTSGDVSVGLTLDEALIYPIGTKFRVVAKPITGALISVGELVTCCSIRHKRTQKVLIDAKGRFAYSGEWRFELVED